MVTTTREPGPRPLPWLRWLLAVVGVGLFVGFAAGLAKPHVRR